jgi:hypothetical protein
MHDDVRRAVQLSSEYFDGVGALYEEETVSIVRCILEHDWTPDAAIKPRVLHPLRVVAAAMELWGEGELKDFADVSGKWKYAEDPETITRLLYAAGREQHRLQHLRERRVRRVQVRSSSESPPAACLPDIGKTFAVGEAPFLPHRGVDCRCTYMGAPRQDALP